MKLFIDTANINEIRELNDLGLIDGVTTNPSLILKSGRNIIEVIEEICSLVNGPVSAEVTATNYDDMIREASHLSKISANVCVKLPLTFDGLRVCKALTKNGYKTNLTLCFTVNQALLAAKAGATFVSPFVGRLDDISLNGMTVIREIRTIFDNYGFQTEILAASIRTVNHVKEAALNGADIVTAPSAILKELIRHPLTDKGLEIFLTDWEKTGQKIS
ncbi:MAG: transaldolase [Candidatus Tokpelaia sp. JSC085]|nr:MAG: transaldolase [Candidatus Tokpelaia sp. JSC085]